MTDELVFYTHPMSRGRIARWMLEEVGHPYRTEIVDYGPAMKGPAYLAVNPMGKVPALRHGEATVTESAAICAYLADAFPEAGLAPAAGSHLRAPYYRWLFFAAGPVEAAASNRMLGFIVPAEREPMIGYGRYELVLDTLETAVSGREYLVGDRFSAADVYLGSHLGFGMQFGTIEKRPAFETYWRRLAARPAAVRAREIDEALVAAHPVPGRPAAAPAPAAEEPRRFSGPRAVLQSDPRYPGWVRGWGVVHGVSPNWTTAGVYATRDEALEAARKAGKDYEVRWGSYDERRKQFVSGDPV
jgi:glutathione S-transferase